MVKVLFVCLGNICRSPMAEGILQRLIEANGDTHRFAADSAGIGAWHEGEPADGRMRAIAEKNGIILTHRARQIRPKDLVDFQYIVNMERSVDDHVRKMHKSRANATAHICMMREFDPEADSMDVPDPYNGTEKDFILTYTILDRSMQHFYKYLLTQYSA